MGFRLVPKSVTLTLNGIISIILRYFAEFSSFRGKLCKSDLLAKTEVHQLSMMDMLCSSR